MSIRDWSLWGAVLAVLLMPGPSNTLLARAGLHAGVRRAWYLIPVQCLGYMVATSLWGYLLHTAVQELPWLMFAVQMLSCLYIAKLAWELLTYASLLPGKTLVANAGWQQLLGVTLINPKAVIFALALFPPSTWRSAGGYLSVMLVFGALVAGVGVLWMAFGARLAGGDAAWWQPHNVQRGAALLLWGFAVWLLLDVWAL